MNLKTGLAPHYRRSESLRGLMLGVLLPLSTLLVLPVIRQGFRPLVMALVTVLACMLTEMIFCLFARKEINITDLSFAVTGLVIALLMPVNAPIWLPCLAGVFAIGVAKMPFGGTGHTPFNPAAAGVAFVTLGWPELVFSYRNIRETIPMPLFDEVVTDISHSPAAALRMGAIPDGNPVDMFFGQVAGPIGTTAIAVILACLLFLLFRQSARWEIPISFLASAALFAALFPRTAGTRLESVLYELLAGSLVFAAVFMATDPATAPKTSLGRSLYGIAGGLLAMSFRHFGAYEEGTVFAILFLNILQPVLDRLTLTLMTSGGKRSVNAKTESAAP